jgi:hypothetical protein
VNLQNKVRLIQSYPLVRCNPVQTGLEGLHDEDPRIYVHAFGKLARDHSRYRANQVCTDSEIADTDLCEVTSAYALCDNRRICTQGCSAGIGGASFVGFGGGVIGGFSV